MKCSHLQASFKARIMRLTEVVSAIVALCVLPSFLLAQVNQARLLGTITDQSGGVIAGATVTVTECAKKRFFAADHGLRRESTYWRQIWILMRTRFAWRPKDSGRSLARACN